MRKASDIEEVMARHADTVWRVCSLYLGEPADRQDAFQHAFLAYALSDNAVFVDEEHVKAWLIKVTRNKCLDQLRSSSRRNVGLDSLKAGCEPVQTDTAAQPGSAVSEIEHAMRSLDDPLRTAVYLALYEGYSALEISSILDAPVNTVYSWIHRGKARLKEVLS